MSANLSRWAIVFASVGILTTEICWAGDDAGGNSKVLSCTYPDNTLVTSVDDYTKSSPLKIDIAGQGVEIRNIDGNCLLTAPRTCRAVSFAAAKLMKDSTGAVIGLPSPSPSSPPAFPDPTDNRWATGGLGDYLVRVGTDPGNPASNPAPSQQDLLGKGPFYVAFMVPVSTGATTFRRGWVKMATGDATFPSAFQVQVYGIFLEKDPRLPAASCPTGTTPDSST